MEGDGDKQAYIRIDRIFLSTPSVWRATGLFDRLSVEADISIHALRVEGDRHRQRGAKENSDFYPRPPCGGRLSTARSYSGSFRISIHALRVEGDHGNTHADVRASAFLSTPSVWRATAAAVVDKLHHSISIHALRVEGDYNK